MNRVAKRAKYLSVLIAIFVFCAAIFINDYRKHAHIWVVHPSNKNIYHNGEITVAGEIYSADDTLLLRSDSEGLTYAEGAITREATLHVIGDKGDNITTGVLSAKKDVLVGYSLISGLYSASSSNNKIQLTIQAELSTIAYEALGNRNGAVGVYNYKTGEILCMVTKPSYDPYYVPDLTNAAYEGVYINRVMNGLYVPGSIMKLVTTYAAIETIGDINSQTFTCDHGMELHGEWINCHANHGNQTFGEALANSCNAAFAQISLQLGADTLESYVKKAGVLQSYTIDGVKTSAGIFNVQKTNDVNLAWAGIGQSTTMVNPMQFMMFVGAIANDGKLKTPYYIDSSSFLSSINIGNNEERLLSSSTASQLQSMMRNNTVATYGDWHFPNLEVCAKTGTAEVEDGSPHSWFVGFSNTDDLPLAFITIVENGSYTDVTAVSVITTVLNSAARLY